MDDDILELDSPEQEPVDDMADDDLLDDLHLPPGAAGTSPMPTSKDTPHKTRKLRKPKEKPRNEQLDYPNSLPYATESIEVMDGRLDVILRRLVDCVRAKD